MPRPQAATWRVALRLAVALTGVSALIVFGGGTALWLVEGSRPGSTMQSWGDGLWLAVSTLTTVGYGDTVLERRIEARLDRIEAQLARLDARLDEWSTGPEGNDPPRGPR